MAPSPPDKTPFPNRTWPWRREDDADPEAEAERARRRAPPFHMENGRTVYEALPRPLPKTGTPVPDDPPGDLRAYGWAPGDYTGHCRTCGNRWVGGAKRCSRCETCARIAKREHEALLAAPLICDGVCPIPEG